MSNFTVLGNVAIANLLLNLSREEIYQFQRIIEDCLIAHSCEGERQYQPQPGIVNRPDGQKILFRPFTSPTEVGTKIVVHPAPSSIQADKQPQQLPLNSVMILCDSLGIPKSLLNAEEITGYRTSINALIPYVWRHETANIIVFGAGKQALWHCRLALALRGSEIKSVSVVNRSEERALKLTQLLKEENEARWKSSCKFGFLSSHSPGDFQKLQSLLSTADVIFCTSPSTQPLFTLASLKLEQRQNKLPLITAVGSWQPDMIEVDSEILRYAENTGARHASGNLLGAIIVDDADNALIHAGEFVQSALKRTELVEVGEILLQRRNESQSEDAGIWLSQGLVVYKSIGVSVTDLAAGKAILELAGKSEIGNVVTGF